MSFMKYKGNVVCGRTRSMVKLTGGVWDKKPILQAVIDILSMLRRVMKENHCRKWLIIGVAL